MPDFLRSLRPRRPEPEHFMDRGATRRPPRGSDLALTGTTRAWLRHLARQRRPYRLCELYPRVANRLAWSWSDVTLAAEMLEELLADRRGGRQGFPRPVLRELQRLQDFNGQQRLERDAEGLWTRLGRIAAWR